MTEAERLDYYKYIRSPEWVHKAFQVRRRAGFKCQACNAPDMPNNRLQVHHRKYPEFNGDEPLSDLICLCDFCHVSVHKNFRIVSGNMVRLEKKARIKAANDDQYNLPF